MTENGIAFTVEIYNRAGELLTQTEKRVRTDLVDDLHPLSLSLQARAQTLSIGESETVWIENQEIPAKRTKSQQLMPYASMISAQLNIQDDAKDHPFQKILEMHQDQALMILLKRIH